MEIILGKSAGFCYGVKRAVEGAKKELENSKDVYCLGEIVHNKSVIANLQKKGIKFVDDINLINNNVIIRAHGETIDTQNRLKEKGIRVINYTCPNVNRIQKIAQKYNQNNYFIILIGVANHPEAIGILSYAKNNSFLMYEKDQYNELVNTIKESKKDKVLIMSQTTYNSKKFDEMVDYLRTRLEYKKVEVLKTICNATEIRQNETIDISKKVNLMIIIGDKKSSNTNKLFEIANTNCNKSMFIQNVDELEIDRIKNVDKIGIMAGASTPIEDINAVMNVIKNMNNKCINNYIN